MARQKMSVDMEALQAAIKDAVIPARKAFAILAAVGVSRFDPGDDLRRETPAPKRRRDVKVRD